MTARLNRAVWVFVCMVVLNDNCAVAQWASMVICKLDVGGLAKSVGPSLKSRENDQVFMLVVNVGRKYAKPSLYCYKQLLCGRGFWKLCVTKSHTGTLRECLGEYEAWRIAGHVASGVPNLAGGHVTARETNTTKYYAAESGINCSCLRAAAMLLK